MAMYETSSDNGKKSSLPIKKITCSNCGKIKPCYSVRRKRLESGEECIQSQVEEEDLKKIICSCDEESFCEWFKRLAGFGPKKVRLSDANDDFNDLLVQFTCDQGSKTPTSQKGTLKGSQSAQASGDPGILGLPDDLVSAIRLMQQPTPVPVEESKDPEVGSETSKTSKHRKRQLSPSQKRGFKIFNKNVPGSEDKIINKRIRKSITESGGIQISTATVFQTYRSRVHYCFNPELSRKSLRASNLTKHYNIAVSKNNQNSARLHDSPSSVLAASIKTEPNHLHEGWAYPSKRLEPVTEQRNSIKTNLKKECSCIPGEKRKSLRVSKSPKYFDRSGAKNYQNSATTHDDPPSVLSGPIKTEFNHLHDGQTCPSKKPELFSQLKNKIGTKFKKVHKHIQCRSISYPTTRREFTNLADRKMYCTRFTPPTKDIFLCRPCQRWRSPKVCNWQKRSFSLSESPKRPCGEERKKSSWQKPQCKPQLVVKSYISPSPRPTPKKRTGTASTSKSKSKTNSCPCSCPCSPVPTPTGVRRNRFSGYKPTSPRRRPTRPKDKRRMNGMAPCSISMTRPENSCTCCVKCNGSISKQTQRDLFETKGRLRNLLQTKKDNASLKDILNRYNCPETSHRSCPALYTQPIPQNGASHSCHIPTSNLRSPLGRMTSWRSKCSPIVGLNFCQSSKYNFSDRFLASDICNQCRQASVMYNEKPNCKKSKCEFVLLPHCIRRTGPRSTVTEYLATIDPPKPLPRMKPNSSQSSGKKDEAVEEAEPALKGGSKKGKGKKGKRGSGSSDKETKSQTLTEPTPESRLDGNNNYGLEMTSLNDTQIHHSNDFSSYTSSHMSDLPVYRYLTAQHTDYSHISSPYTLTNRPGLSYTTYSASGNPTYMNTFHDFRRVARPNYRNHPYGMSAEGAPMQYSNDFNLNALHATMYGRLSYRSASAAGDITAQANGNSASKTKSHEGSSQFRQAKKRTAPPYKKSTGQLHGPKSTETTFTPRKSFIEGEDPTGILYKSHWKMEGPGRDIRNNSEQLLSNLVETPGTNPSQHDLNKIEEDNDNHKHLCAYDNNNLDGDRNLILQENENSESNIAPRSLPNGDVHGHVTGDVANVLTTVVDKSSYTGILEGKESSVDAEDFTPPAKSTPPAKRPVQEKSKLLSRTVRKIEPCNKPLPQSQIPIFQSLIERISENNTITTAAHATPSMPLVAESNLPLSVASEHNFSGHQDRTPISSHVESRSQVPVFQRLMDRFNDTVHIFVHTKGRGERSSHQTQLRGDATCNAERNVSLLNETPAIKEDPRLYGTAIDNIEQMQCPLEDGAVTLAGWSGANKSRNRASCETPSECASLSEQGILTHQIAMEKVSSAASSSSTLAPAQSQPSLAAVSAERTQKAKKYTLEVGICRTTKRVFTEKSVSRKPVPAANGDYVFEIANKMEKKFDEERIIERTIGGLGPSDTSVDPENLRPQLYSAANANGEFLAPIISKAKDIEGDDLISVNSASRTSLPRSDINVDLSPAQGPKRSNEMVDRNIGSSVDPPFLSSGSPDSVLSVIDNITNSHSLFKKVDNSEIVMTAKTSFLSQEQGESMTTFTPSGADANSPPRSSQEMRSASRAGSIADAIQKYISLYGSPV